MSGEKIEGTLGPDPSAFGVDTGRDSLSPESLKIARQEVQDALVQMGVKDIKDLKPADLITFNKLVRERALLDSAQAHVPKPKPSEVASGEYTPEMRKYMQEFMKFMTALQTFAQGAKQLPPDAIDTNPWQSGTGLAAFTIAMQTLSTILSWSSQLDAQVAIKLRNAIRDAVAGEMDAIEEQGRLQRDQYFQMATYKVAQAAVSFGMAMVTVGVPALYKDSEGKGMSETTQKTFTAMMEGLQHSSQSAFDAATNFVQASYAYDIKAKEALQTLYQNFIQSLGTARENALNRYETNKQNIDKLIDNLMQFHQKAFSISIGMGH